MGYITGCGHLQPVGSSRETGRADRAAIRNGGLDGRQHVPAAAARATRCRQCCGLCDRHAHQRPRPVSRVAPRSRQRRGIHAAVAVSRLLCACSQRRALMGSSPLLSPPRRADVAAATQISLAEALAGPSTSPLGVRGAEGWAPIGGPESLTPRAHARTRSISTTGASTSTIVRMRQHRRALAPPPQRLCGLTHAPMGRAMRQGSSQVPDEAGGAVAETSTTSRTVSTRGHHGAPPAISLSTVGTAASAATTAAAANTIRAQSPLPTTPREKFASIPRRAVGMSAPSAVRGPPPFLPRRPSTNTTTPRTPKVAARRSV